MAEQIPWESPAWNDDGPCGTLRDVVERWRAMISRDHEALTGVTVERPVMLDGWTTPCLDLLPSHLDQIADRLHSAPPG